MASLHTNEDSHLDSCISLQDTQTIQQAVREAANDYTKLIKIICDYRIGYGDQFPVNAEKAEAAILECITEVRNNQYDKQGSMDKRSARLVQCLLEERSHQQKCQRLYDEATEEMSNLNNFMTCQLHLYSSNFLDIIKERSCSLQQGRVRILIAGEICAGKSSILNMFMGGEYMPVEHGACTRIPCEVINSNDKTAYLHYEDIRRYATAIELDDDSDHPSWHRVRRCVETTLDDNVESNDKSKSRLEKVVIHWPFPIFPRNTENTTVKGRETTAVEEDDTMVNGVTFIDAPGIYDTDDSFYSIYNYIQSADAFLLVINNSDNSGVARDRMLRLMSIIREVLERKHGMFYPKCALFVCNKWDRVRTGRQDTLKEEIYDKLSELWPGLSEKQLVPFDSSTEAIQTLQKGHVSKTYERFYYSMCTFIENAARIQTEAHAWWLKSFLEKTIAIKHKTVELIHFGKAEKRSMQNHLQENKREVLNFEQRRKEIEANINKETGVAISNVKEQTRNILTENKVMMSTWETDQIPIRQENESWNQLNEKLKTAIINRTEKQLDAAVQKQHIEDEFYEKVKTELNTLVSLYQCLERQMPLIAEVAGKKTLTLADLGTMATSSSKWPFIAAGIAFLIPPLAPVIFILWHIYEEIYLPHLLDDEKNFLENPKEYMRKQTSTYIDYIIKDRLISIAEASIQNVPQNAKYMLTFFHACVDRYLKSIDELYNAISSKNAHIEDGDDDNLRRIHETKDKTEALIISELFRDEIDENLLNFDVENSAKHIGHGHLTVVCKGILHGENKDKEVAVKAIKQPIGDGRYPDSKSIFREYFTMRMLSFKPEKDRKNIVDFFGALTQVSRSEYRLLLVMELCDHNLNELLKNGDNKLTLPSKDQTPFPGDDPAKGTGWGYALNIALQAARGLEFVHDNNIVHRDIKPQNFLVKFTADDNVIVKIADVGLSREANLITTTNIGTLLYNAPEVQLDKLPHTLASDIYSFVLVLWEIWYGETVFKKMNLVQLRTVKRSTPTIRNVTPPDLLKNVLELSWSDNRRRRPNIKTIVDSLVSLTEAFQWPKPR